jgi:hypothetical protein
LMREQGAVMEMDEFDAFTRRLGGAGSSRRMALRALGGALLAGALTGAAGRLGLAEETEVKKTSGRTPRAERKPHGRAQSEDKGKGKRKKRRKHRRERGNTDQSGCTGGSCSTPDQDQCPPGTLQCADGRCIAADQCCPEVSLPTCGACEEPACDQGEAVCRSTCQFEGAECCNGHCLAPCPGDLQRHPENCQCLCPSGEEVLADQMTCCPYDEACFFNDAGQGTICCGEGLICVGGDLCT